MINLLDEYKKKHPRNGKIEGVQSLYNKETYVPQCDEVVDDSVGRWIETPSFVRESLVVKSENECSECRQM
jgi:hypothetical protein